MKTLVIPDVHNKIRRVDAIIAQENNADRYIFLGDIWDDFDDSPDDAREVAKWVRQRVFDERFVFLWGNHDISYGFKNYSLPCSGYSIYKDIAIWDILEEKHFKPWKFFWFENEFLLTHGGLHPNYLPRHWHRKVASINNLKQYLFEEEAKCVKILNMNYGVHWFFQPGFARNGGFPGTEVGGLLWCDAHREFVPIPGISQIFGHSIYQFPALIYNDINQKISSNEKILNTRATAADGLNVALDCHLSFYAVIEDGILSIKSSPVL